MSTTRGVREDDGAFGRVIRVMPSAMEALYTTPQRFDPPKGQPEPTTEPREGWLTPEEAHNAAYEERRARWAAQDAAEEEGWRRQEAWLAEVEGREPDFGPSKAPLLGRHPGSIVARTRAEQRAAPSNTPEGRRARYVRGIAKRLGLSVEEAETRTPRKT